MQNLAAVEIHDQATIDSAVLEMEIAKECYKAARDALFLEMIPSETAVLLLRETAGTKKTLGNSPNCFGNWRAGRKAQPWTIGIEPKTSTAVALERASDLIALCPAGLFRFDIMLPKLLLILLAGSVAWAQSNQASISGVVADEQGAVIPAAKVSAVNVRLNYIRRPSRTARVSTRFQIFRSAPIRSPSRTRASAEPFGTV